MEIHEAMLATLALPSELKVVPMVTNDCFVTFESALGTMVRLV
jgi:hypothetical protein